MTPSAPLDPADRLALIIDGLCRSVAARIAGRRLAGPLIILIWTRLRRIGRDFAGLAARIRAGRTVRRSATGRRPARPRGPRGPRRLPQGFAWLLPLVPEAAAGYGSQLRHLLAEPEMAALIAAAPQARRILRPLCRMLGVRLPPGPAPKDAAPAAPDPPATAEPIGPPPPSSAPPRPPPRIKRRTGLPPNRA